jgi:hypothetical protein
MRRSAIFWESFLDGFTMTGFFNRLRMPGAPTVLFEPEAPASSRPWPPLTFEPERSNADQVAVAGNLKAVPQGALRVMIELLEREDASRQHPKARPNEADYASSR